MQELFQLHPPLDLIGLAEAKAKQALNIYSGLMNDYNLNKGHEVPQGELHDKLGKYSNEGLKLYLNICATDRRDKIGEFLLNGMETQPHYLEHFRDSTFGFPLDCREEQERRCMVDYVVYEQEQLLLTFKEDASGKYDRLE
ncbi:putative Beta-lactamase/transpeptidase-like protein [Seiridium cardinale]